MLLVVLADVALVAGLRPAAHLRVLRLDALDLILPHHLAGAVDEDAGEVRVRDDGGIAGILVVQAGERIQVRLVVDIQAVVLDRRVELVGFEEAVGAGAGEDGHTVGRRLQLVGKVTLDALHVGAEARVLG